MSHNRMVVLWISVLLVRWDGFHLFGLRLGLYCPSHELNQALKHLLFTGLVTRGYT